MTNHPELSVVRAQPAGLNIPAASAHARSRHNPSHDSLVEIVWRQRRLMLLGAGIAFVIGLFYVIVATRQYTSTARMMVSRGRPSLLTESHAAPASDDDNFLTTQREVVASNPVIALALSSPEIHDLRTFVGEGNRFDLLKKKLTVEVGKKVDLLSVSFESKYPDEASTIVTAIVKAYIEYESTQRQQANEDTTAALNLDKQKWEGDLSQKSAELLAYRAAHNVVDSGTTPSQSTDSRLHALNDALIAAHLDAVSAKVQYDQAQAQLALTPDLDKQAQDPASFDETNASPEDMVALKQELAMAKARAREMERQYLPGHPQVQAAIRRVEQLTVEQAIALKSQLALASAKEADLQKLCEQEQQAAIQNSAALAESNRLQSDVARLQQMVDSVDRRTREIDLSSDDAAVSISVMEPAHTDPHPSKPQKTTTMALAIIAGLLLSAVGAVVRDRYDRRLHSARDVWSLLGLDVYVGQLPAMSSEITPTDRAQQTHLAPESPLAESVRALRASLLYSNDGNAPKTVMIASPSPGDGRSTLASNLAISLAEAGKRVLLLDADLRSPMQDWIFSLDKFAGLAAAMNSDEESDQRPSGIQYSGVKHLDVLTAGPAVADPIQLLNDSSFAEMLEKLADEYDHVIVDSPSIGSGPDARILAAHCDACLVVLREGQTNQRTAEQALASLGSVGAKVIGVMLNRVPSIDNNQRIGALMQRWPRLISNRAASHATARENGAEPFAGLVGFPRSK